jgi:hypothetical protein
MILAILGLIWLAVSLCLFWGVKDNNLNLLPPVILFILGAGASIADPVILAPVGRAFISLITSRGA